MSPNANERPKKLQRISQACDLCHRRSIRCRPSAENPQQQCQNCYDFAVDCTYHRPSKRRRHHSVGHQSATSPATILPSQHTSVAGTQVLSPFSDILRHDSHASSMVSAPTSTPGARLTGATDYTGAYKNVRQGRSEDTLGVAWRSFALSSSNLVEEYLTVYMDVVYPAYPLFHAPTLWDRIKKRDHLTDQEMFASVMAACALAAARARDGAVGDTRRFTNRPEQASEIFFAAAHDAVYKDLSKPMGLGYMRACGLLAVTAIQYGQIQTVHQYMGTYHTLAAMQNFHDESRWPTETSVVEREERRRVFWSMYSLDIYCSVVFDSVTKSQENHSNVRYPSEVSDEDLFTAIGSPRNEENWLRGYNFTTDLYRVLEHSMKRMRRNKPIGDDRICITRLLIADGLPEAQVMDSVVRLYYQLPAAFKNYSLRPDGNKRNNFIGFQAANIQATLQLVRMTLLSTSPSHDVNHKCDVAQQALSVFHSIAPEYLRAISTPLVYHLGGIGSILASVMEGLLCEESYRRVRSLLVSMADLLEGLESGLQPTAGASRDLRKQIDKIDSYMEARRRLMHSLSQPEQHPNSHVEQQQHFVPPPEGMVNGNTAAAPSQQVPLMDGLGFHAPYEEFRLPSDLVSDGAWPWPFSFTPVHAPQMAMDGIGYHE